VKIHYVQSRPAVLRVFYSSACVLIFSYCLGMRHAVLLSLCMLYSMRIFSSNNNNLKKQQLYFFRFVITFMLKCSKRIFCLSCGAFFCSLYVDRVCMNWITVMIIALSRGQTIDKVGQLLGRGLASKDNRTMKCTTSKLLICRVTNGGPIWSAFYVVSQSKNKAT